MFEKWGYVKAHGNGYRHVTLMQPIIELTGDYKIDETEMPWLLAEKLAETVKEYGPDAVMGLTSARCTNEENYLFQKFLYNLKLLLHFLHLV